MKLNEAPIHFVTPPFTREIDVSQRFPLPQFDEAIESLYRAVQKRMIASFIAPAGCGKTMVLRGLRSRLAEARYQVAYLKVSNLSQRDMCREIAHAVNAKPAAHFNTLVRNLDESFSNTYRNQGKQPVLLIDDAHEIRPTTVSVLKLLTNFEMDSRLVVSIVLTGQPKLRALLQKEELQDITQRIYHHEELRLLSQEEAIKYLKHRCSIVALNPFPFDESAQQSIFTFSRGNMRIMDLLCLKALELASQRKLFAVGESLVLEAKKTTWM